MQKFVEELKKNTQVHLMIHILVKEVRLQPNLLQEDTVPSLLPSTNKVAEMRLSEMILDLHIQTIGIILKLN